MAWPAVGLEIPKVSGAQDIALPHVNLGDFQPGDFISMSTWSAHVGMCVGGGYVNATSCRNKSDAVRYVGGTGGIVDAVCPR